MGKPDVTNFPWLGGDPTYTFDKGWQLNIGGVKCAIYLDEDDGIIERNPEHGREATVRFICNWSDRISLMAGLLGTVDYSGGKISRTPPFYYPVSQNDQLITFGQYMHCTSISNIRGLHWWTDPSGNVGLPRQQYWGAYVHAVITAEFTSPLYWTTADIDTPAFDDLLAQTYLVTRIKAGGEVLSPPMGAFIWANGPNANGPLPAITAAHMRTRSEISCTRIRLPLYPANAVKTAIGSLNLNPITIGGYAYKKGAILFNNVVPEARSDPVEGGIIWDVEYILLGNSPASTGQIDGLANTDPLDWNWFLDTDGNWRQIFTKGTNQLPFRYVDWGPGGANDIFSNTIS